MTMRLLYLVRHASPTIQPAVPARDWTLSERGIAEAHELAATAEPWGLTALYSSSETKASATALIVGDALGLPVHVVDGFDELQIPEWIGNADAFNESVRSILEDGEMVMRGAETARAAAARFAAGIRIVSEGAFPAAVVSHGRIITAWLSSEGLVEEPFDTWRSIPMPGYAVVDLARPSIVAPFRT